MATNIFEDFDEESQNQLAGLKMLDFEQVMENRQNSSFQSVIKNKSFEERSNEYSKKNPFGEGSVFYDNDGKLVSMDINIGKLMKIIKSYTDKKDILKYEFSDFEVMLATDMEFFFLNEKKIAIQAQLNTLNGEIDFQADPYFRFNIDVNKQKIQYILCYPFRKYKDSKDANKLGIILSLAKGNEFQELLSYLGKALQLISQKNVLEKFNNAFLKAKDKSEILDFLYENVPDFVLKERKDELLYKDLVLLSKKGIDNWGTNENIAILNIINNIKNAKWFFEQVNKDPETIRLLFEKFSLKYIDQLILSLSKIGLKNWSDEELAKAWNFDLEYKEMFEKEERNLSDSHITYTGFAYYDKLKKKYKIGTAIFGYKTGTSVSPDQKREIGPQELVYAYKPMKIMVDKNTIYVPVFIAEYFTNEKIDNERTNILNNIAGGLLPEITALRGSTLLRLSNFFKGKKITTVDELIDFLNAIDENVLATDLDKVGVEVLFRGTTRNAEGLLFSGNANTVAYGTSTSTDPIRAVIFGVESATQFRQKGFLQIYLSKDLKGLKLQMPNRRVGIELEAILNTDPENLSKLVAIEIPVEEGRKLIKEIYDIELPKHLSKGDFPDSTYLLQYTKKLTPEEALKFYNKAINLK
ncbi:hypothetical protein [Flavobacterium lindanitolerans]|uniref:hypothetical protein n=1 Tax=Flavobacterium lindanitolerans TaxID=428988 RepID=UPI0028089F70|nr:hypothetical protein [Flavobacterium lindanitolerans]MDQ7960265.1 hypothetical protein [Flavobacterium lindanitolerans]